jgi:hypothetical protein
LLLLLLTTSYKHNYDSHGDRDKANNIHLHPKEPLNINTTSHVTAFLSNEEKEHYNRTKSLT